jgi:uncharacterized protein
MDTAFSFGKISKSVKKQKRANNAVHLPHYLRRPGRHRGGGGQHGVACLLPGPAALRPQPGQRQYDQYGGPGDDRLWLLVLLLKGDAGALGGLWRYAFFQLTGALIGGWLLVQFPGKIFQKLVPFFVLFSAGLLLYSGRQKQPKQATKLGRIGAYFGLFVAGIYAGYFGAASGVLTLIFLTALSDSSFVVINAIKSVIGSLANLVALALFAFKGGVN